MGLGDFARKDHSHGCVMNGIKVLELKAGRLGGNS